jgi:hypothetical protein
LEDDTAGVDDVESAAIPVHLGIKAVTGDTGGVFDNSDSLTDKAVKKCGFSDIWTPNNDDGGHSFSHGNASGSGRAA